VESDSGRRLRSIPEVDDRRQYQRVEPEGARIEASLSGKVVALDIDNLSEGGALLAGRLDMEGGVTLNLRLLLPGVAPFSLPARVLRHLSRAGRDFTAVTFLTGSSELSHWISELVLEGLYAAFPETD
jgi:PilZ domain